MSFVQRTACVNADDKVSPVNPSVLVALGAIATLLATVFLTPYAAIPFLLIIIGYCRWWLYDRLVCLGSEECAIGLVGKVEPPSNKSGFDKFDTDYSINLLLAPHQAQELPAGYPGDLPPMPPGEDPKEWAEDRFKEALHRQIADDGLQGRLIKETATTGDRKTVFNTKRYDFEGYFSTIGGAGVLHHHQPYLHCEFEGEGVWKLLNAAELALAFATAAAVACTVPVIGWIICYILEAIAGVIALVGLFSALNDEAEPSVYDPVTGQTSKAVHSGSDILFVRGTWVFDTAHEGYNEIHPIKSCLLVGRAVYDKYRIDWDYAIAPYLAGLGRWQLDFSVPTAPKPIKVDGPPKSEDWIAWVKSWCDLDDTARHPLTVSNQQRPENRWRVHPAVDGGRIVQAAAGFIG